MDSTTDMTHWANTSVFDHIGNVTLTSIMDNVTLTSIMDNVTTGDPNVTTTAATVRPAAEPLQGFIDTATKDLVVEIVNCYLLPVVFVFGAVGNVMSFVVLLVHGMDSSTNVLLLGVTVSDFCYLVTMFSRKVSCLVSKADFLLSRKIETGLLPTVYMVHRIFGLTTPFLTMLITLERCLAVALPFKVQKLVTPMRMRIAVISVYVIAAAAVSPFFFIYKVNWYPDRVTGELYPRLAGTDFYYENFDLITAYNNILLSGLFYFGPMAIVICCTVFILITVRRSAQWRKGTAQGGERSEERRMTKMLLAVALMYVCFYIPGAAIGIANQATSDFGSLGGRYNNLFYLVAGIQLLLYACNSSFNFVIYMLLSKKFYNTYLRIFLCRKDVVKDEKTRNTNLTSSGKQTSSAVSNDPETAISEKKPLPDDPSAAVN